MPAPRERRPPLRTIPWAELHETPRVMGSGSYGSVRVYTWAARGGMEVAVKELSLAAVLAAFQRVAQLQARLEHDNVARVYALAESTAPAPPRYGLVMKLYESPVSALLRAGSGAPASTLPLRVREAFVLQIARGLAYMHGEGIVCMETSSLTMCCWRAGAVRWRSRNLAWPR